MSISKPTCRLCGAGKEQGVLRMMRVTGTPDFVGDQAHDRIIYICAAMTACQQRQAQRRAKETKP